MLCPEGAACLTAVRHLRASGWIGADEDVVVLNTGAGLKYPGTCRRHPGPRFLTRSVGGTTYRNLAKRS